MADSEIDIKIKASIDAVDAAKSVGELKKAIKDLESQAVEFAGTNQAAFDKVAAAAGKARDKVSDVKKATSELSGEPIENISKSFGNLLTSLKTLDIEGFKNSFGALKTSFSDFSGTVLSGLRTQLSTTSGAFKLLAGSIAATGIGALVLIIVGLITHFDDLAASGGLIGKVFTYIGDTVKRVTQFFKDFLDMLGLTDFKATELAEKEKKRNEELDKQREETAEKEKKRKEKEVEEHKKALEDKAEADKKYAEDFATLQDKYYDDDREKLRKKYQDDLDFIKGKGGEAEALRQKIREEGQAALDAFDQKVIDDKAAKNQERLDKIANQNAAAEELYIQSTLSGEERDQALFYLHNESKIEAMRLAGVSEQDIERNTAAAKADIHKGYLDQQIVDQDAANKAKEAKYQEDVAANKRAEDAKNQQVQAGFNLARNLSGAIQAIGDLAAIAASSRTKKDYKERVEVARKQFKLNKGLQIVNAGIQTAQAVIAAYSSGAAVPIAGVALGPIMAAVAGIAGAAQIAAIAAKQFNPESPPASDSSGGGGPIANSIPSPAAAIPAAAGAELTPKFQASSFFGLGQNNLLTGGGTGDSRVFVVESDITNTQNRVRTTEDRSTLGG